VFLAANLAGTTRTAVQKLIDAGGVTVNGVPVRKSHKTVEGHTYIVVQDEPEVSVALKQDIPLDVVFEDEDIIVVNKPQGMVIHPAPGHSDGTLVNALLFHCGNSLSGIGGVVRPGIVHRIDKDTSGLVIAAKNDAAHLSLAAQLSSRTLTREYDAIACGVIKQDSGTIDAPIGRHPVDRKKQAAGCASGSASQGRGRSVHPVAPRQAITHYGVVMRYSAPGLRGGYTHVKCTLETGRTHQIRVHLASIGYPILGDMVYGRKKPELGVSCQCLHAQKLRFTHPRTSEDIEIIAQPPAYFEKILAKLSNLVH